MGRSRNAAVRPAAEARVVSAGVVILFLLAAVPLTTLDGLEFSLAVSFALLTVFPY